MRKKLSDMSLEELWELFPIFLVPHNPNWKIWFKEEEQYLRSFIPSEHIVRLEHIGSTAVPEIMAKNIIDVMLVVDSFKYYPTIKKLLFANGYILMSEDGYRMSFNKGYTEEGFADKVFHIHIRLNNDIDEMYFRNFLISHPKVAKYYEELKIELWHQYEHNRDAYTNGKTEFVRKYTKLAKEKNRV